MAELAEGGLLEGRVALVTGASRGIGREIALRLASAGASLLLVSRAGAALEEVARLIGESAAALTADISKRDEIERLTAYVAERWGTPDILINNAGAFFLARADALEPALFEESLEVNVRAPFLLTRAFLPQMLRRGSGHIVSIGSVADRTVYPENAAYASSKFALRALHEVIRAETKGSGVRATIVSPGPVDTRLWDPIDPDHREGFTPRESMLDPYSVADAVLYVVTRPQRVTIEELRISRS